MLDVDAAAVKVTSICADASHFRGRSIILHLFDLKLRLTGTESLLLRQQKIYNQWSTEKLAQTSSNDTFQWKS